MKSIQILDCTLRDGGHHNSWNFPDKLVSVYLEGLQEAGVSYCELGYRRPYQDPSLGPWAFCEENYTKNFLKQWRVSLEKVNLGFMVDLKDFMDSRGRVDLALVLSRFEKASESCFSFVRIAAHFQHLYALKELLNPLLDLGYHVSLNLMRSGNAPYKTLVEALENLAKHHFSEIAVLSFADSFGGLSPSATRELILLGKKIWPSLLGFHAHDNRQLALLNSLEAIGAGVDFVDSTVAGMGKGAGNTPTETLIFELGKKGGLYSHKPFEKLLRDYFLPLKKEFVWGSDYFYYIGAEKGLHPDKIALLQKMEL